MVDVEVASAPPRVPRYSCLAARDASLTLPFGPSAVLPTPKLSTSKWFYLRKMNTYLYGIWAGQAQQHTFAFWNETMAKKGSAEVISSLYQHLITRGTSATHGIFWGDNTSSQLKNMFVMLFHDQLVRQDGGGLGLFDRVDAKVHTPHSAHALADRAHARFCPPLTPRPALPNSLGRQATRSWSTTGPLAS